MPWDSAFLDYLEERGPFKPIIKVVRHTFTEWGQPADGYIASTHPNFDTDLTQTIIEGSVRVNGYRLNPQTWTVSGGGFSFMVSGNPCAYLTRGHLLRLYWNFDVFDPADAEILDWGVVRSISAHGGSKLATGVAGAGPWVVTCDPWYSFLQQRPTDQPAQVQLFNSIDDESDIDSDYTAGDGTLVVLSTTGFDTHTDSDTGGMLVHGNDRDFYARFVGTTGGTDFDTFEAIPDISDNDADAPNEVEERAYMVGHPSEIYRRLLTSTGTGLNGTYDTYPKQWSFGMDEDYVDNDDADAYMTASNVDPTGLYMHIFAEPVDNGMQWMLSWLSPGGWFPVITQGAFSLRCAVAPEETDPNDDVTITDADIDDGPDAISFDAFSSDAPVVYRAISVHGATETSLSAGFATETAALPAQILWTVDYSDPAAGCIYDPTNVEEIGALISIWTRLEQFYAMIPQVYSLRCAGLRHYARAVGSRVLLSTGQDSSGTFARLVERDGSYPRAKSALVVGWLPDLANGKITLELAVMPEFDTELP